MRNLLCWLPLLLLLSFPLWKSSLTSFLTPRGEFNPKLLQERELPSGQNFLMEGVVIVTASGGKMTWEIEAARTWSNEASKNVEMADIQARYVGTEGDPVLITSKKASYDRETRYLILRDQVVLNNPRKEQQLFSEEMHYKEESELVSSPGTVRIVTPTMQLEAGGMVYNLQTGGYDFGDRVQVVL